MPDRRDADGPQNGPKGPDRRTNSNSREFLKRHATGLERRRGPGRRLSDFLRAAEEGELSQEQFMFVSAVYAFKKANDVTFPAWTDVLEIVRLLGYRKTMPSELNLRNVDDFCEAPNAPSGVRHESDREAA